MYLNYTLKNILKTTSNENLKSNSCINPTQQGNFFDLFPNPAQNKISFRSKTSGHSQKEYRIFDAFGILKLENKAEISSSKPEIDISGLSPGIYFLEIVDFENNKFKTSFAVMRQFQL